MRVVCWFAGASAGLPLPYRGQAAIVMPSEEELEAVPEGMCREYLIRSRMTRSVCTTSGPLPHAGLGLPGYVQATSPIRRYMDLLAHWQLKVRRCLAPQPRPSLARLHGCLYATRLALCDTLTYVCVLPLMVVRTMESSRLSTCCEWSDISEEAEGVTVQQAEGWQPPGG